MVKEVDKLTLTETEAKVCQAELKRELLHAWVRAKVASAAHSDLVGKFHKFMARYNELYPGQFPPHVAGAPGLSPEI